MPEEAPVMTATRTWESLFMCRVASCSWVAAGSGLGDVAAERLEGDVLRLWSTPLVGVEGVDGDELVVGQVEVEDVEVLRDAVRLGRLRDDRAALLQVPAQHHLGRGLPV